jgi:hypothetical protein
MFEKIFNSMLGEEDDGVTVKKVDLGREVKEEIEKFGEEIEGEVKEELVKPRIFTIAEILPPLILFILAFGLRLGFMLLNDPQSPGYGWYGDVYHHWQIAYLTKEVGLSHGFLRLWDLKGMEFFWGLAHPLALMILFTLTSSVSIVIPRLLSIFCGSMVVIFAYLLFKRYFSKGTAFLCGIWAACFSVALFSDSLGMQEQLGLFFLFGGILLWPKMAIGTGLLWAVAAMTRSEYWLFSLGLVFAAFFDREKGKTEKKVLMFISYAIPILIYMKYLQNYTGNPIFPIYWNFLASFIGKWFNNVEVPLLPNQIIGQWFGRGLFTLGVLGTLFFFWKRPKAYLIYLLGFFNITFIGFMFGFGAYIHGFFERFYVDRLLSFPYVFLGWIVIIFLFDFLPKLFGKAGLAVRVLSFLIIIGGLLATQLAWIPIMHYFKIAQRPYETELAIASFIAKNDVGGQIVFPAGRPALTYALVRNHQISGKRLISDMYDPIYYKKAEDTPADIEENLIHWFEKEKIGLIVYDGKAEYLKLFANQPDRFRKIDTFMGTTLYEFLR